MRQAVVNEGTKADPEFAGLCECKFLSARWPTAEIAEARILQHRKEHETGELMPPLSEFRQAHGLVATADGRAVFPKDATIVGGEA